MHNHSKMGPYKIFPVIGLLAIGFAFGRFTGHPHQHCCHHNNSPWNQPPYWNQQHPMNIQQPQQQIQQGYVDSNGNNGTIPQSNVNNRPYCPLQRNCSQKQCNNAVNNQQVPIDNNVNNNTVPQNTNKSTYCPLQRNNPPKQNIDNYSQDKQ